MKEKEFKKLATCIEKGTNPVEVAEYGRESTHKGYLTWLLNSNRWDEAGEAIDLLVDSASITWPKEDDRYREIAENWKKNFPEIFWCQYERKIGANSKVDLLLCTNPEHNMNLPIELKTDTELSKTQLNNYSSNRENDLGLVFLLGSSAVRNDDQKYSTEVNGCFGILTVEDILSSWQKLYHSMPQPGKDWYDSLKNEAIRLNCAFEIENYDSSICDTSDFEWWKYGYRTPKHLYYSKLNSVRNVLRDSKNNELTKWILYDGGHNTVLNLRESKHSWKDISNLEKSRYYWEFINDKLALKVEYTGNQSEDAFRGTKSWISGKKDSLNQTEWSWPDGVIPSRPRESEGTWISVFHWKLTFDSAESVADQAVKIIELVDKSKILAN